MVCEFRWILLTDAPGTGFGVCLGERFVLVFILILQSARQVAPSGIKESYYRPPGYNPTHSTGNNGAQPSSVSR